MKKIILASIAATSLTAVSVAMAGGPDQINVPASKGGLYLGVGIGAGALDAPSDIVSAPMATALGITNQNQADNWGFAGRLNAGYLVDVSSKLLVGGEVGYTYLPKTKYTFDSPAATNNQLKYTDYAIDMLGVAKYMLDRGFNVFGKLGAAYVNQEAKLNWNGASDKDTTSKVLPEVAVGAGFDITPVLGVEATYAHIFGNGELSQISIDGANNDVPSIDTVMVGISYKMDV